MSSNFFLFLNPPLTLVRTRLLRYPECPGVGLNYPEQNPQIYQAGDDPVELLLPFICCQTSDQRAAEMEKRADRFSISSDMSLITVRAADSRLPLDGNAGLKI